MSNDKDKLKDIFCEVKLESPSINFEQNLMNKIQMISLEQKKKTIRNTKWKDILSITGGILVIIAIPIIIFNLLGWNLKGYLNFSSNNNYLISVALITLVLLISDTLIRKYIINKKDNC